uniref:Uncharacterized protein n=1 Tax=Aquila chrysaetos chrysaetos TaxID=223781 RepID=A0A663EK78_AQUCH
PCRGWSHSQRNSSDITTPGIEDTLRRQYQYDMDLVLRWCCAPTPSSWSWGEAEAGPMVCVSKVAKLMSRGTSPSPRECHLLAL